MADEKHREALVHVQRCALASADYWRKIAALLPKSLDYAARARAAENDAAYVAKLLRLADAADAKGGAE